MSLILIRPATLEDAAAMLEVYRPFVEKTAISFEITVPTAEEFRSRIEKKLGVYPCFVAEMTGAGGDFETGAIEDGAAAEADDSNESQIVGYAYLSPFVGREAYRFSAETTIYISDEAQGLGAGRKLYEALEEAALKQNITDLYACIGVPVIEDEYLTMNSVHFHEHLGYRMIGTFPACGFKFGRWYDMAWMGKNIAPHEAEPKEWRPMADFK